MASEVIDIDELIERSQGKTWKPKSIQKSSANAALTVPRSLLSDRSASLLPITTTKQKMGLDDHLQRGRVGMPDQTDPSLSTLSTIDVSYSTDESFRSNSDRDCIGVHFRGYQPAEEYLQENSVQINDKKSPQDLGEGESRTWPAEQQGEELGNEKGSETKQARTHKRSKSPTSNTDHENLEWSQKARLEAMKKAHSPLNKQNLSNATPKLTSSPTLKVTSLHSVEEGSCFEEIEFVSGHSVNSMEEADSEETYIVGSPGPAQMQRGGSIFGSHRSRERSSSYMSTKEGSLFGSSLFGSHRSKMRSGIAKQISLRSLGSFGGSLRVLIEPDTGHLSRDDYALIEDALKKNFMFKNLCKSALRDLVLAFTPTEAVKGDIIVRQGDTSENGCVYVIAEGLCSVVVDGKTVPGPYGTLAPRAIFGELGVLQKARRAATISVKSDHCVLFQAPGEAFTQVVDPNQLVDDDDLCCPARLDEDLREIDDAIDQLCGSKTLHGGDIVRQYQPSRVWLWSQWRGTILQHNIRITLMVMLLSLVFVILVRAFAEPTWAVGLAPDEDHPLIQRLDMIKKVWLWQTTFTTFVLTFYVGEAFQYYKHIMKTSRSIQGRLNDFHLVLATSIERENGTFSASAEALMDDVASSARLFHAFFWASQARRFRCLATPIGFERMAQRGLMTPKQVHVLKNIGTAENTKFHACMEWMMIRAWQGVDEGVLRDTDAVIRSLLDLICRLRAHTATVDDDGKARMPLAYTHFVQLLVDTFVLMSPFALYPDLGGFSILCVGMITLFYTGLLDLAKIFLDPLDNENYTKTSINLGVDLGVLTRETNVRSVHFKASGSSVPFETTKKLF